MKEILFEDAHLMVLNKPAGIPAQPDKTHDLSLQEMAAKHCKREMFLVHRIDRPVSGLLLMAKNKATAGALQNSLHSGGIEKLYLAAVDHLPPAAEGTLTHYLNKDGLRKRAQAFDAPQPGADEAVLHYRLLGSGNRYHLLEIRLQTGRFHQIRAQLAAIGCIVKGDVKYGARRSNTDRSIHLHAWRLRFEHPFSGEQMSFEAPLPVEDPVWKALEVFSK